MNDDSHRNNGGIEMNNMLPDLPELPPMDDSHKQPSKSDVRREHLNRGDMTNRIKYSKKGNPYLETQAQNENDRLDLSVWCTHEVIQDNFGQGTRTYYLFLRYLTIFNLLLCGPVFANWIKYLIYKYHDLKINAFRSDDLFVSAYPESLKSIWKITCYVSFGMWFALGPLFYVYVGIFHKPLIDTVIEEEGFIDENLHYTRKEKAIRRTISYLLFFVSLGVSVGINFGLTKLQNYLNNKFPDKKTVVGFTISLLTSIVVTIEGLLWKIICLILTQLEVYSTWDRFRKLYGVKLLFWKLANITILYYFISLNVNTNACSGVSYNAGVQFILILLVDLVVVQSVNMIVPVVRFRLFRAIQNKSWAKACSCCIPSKGSDDDAREEFDISDEYLDLIYRQFIVYTGMLIVPILPIIAMIINLIEYPLDKYRMLKMCQRPHFIKSRLRTFVLVMTTLTALAAFFTYPNGALFVLFLRNCQFTG